MHPYLPHLLEDIANAHRTDVPKIPEQEQGFTDYFAEVERYLSGENSEHTFGYYCGLAPEDFPPSQIFSEEEIKKLFNAFGRMMHSWNAGISIPEKVPFSHRYQLMVLTLTKGFTVLNTGFVEFDFCSGYAPDCELGKYCSCREFWDELEEDGLQDSGEDPFM